MGTTDPDPAHDRTQGTPAESDPDGGDPAAGPSRRGLLFGLGAAGGGLLGGALGYGAGAAQAAPPPGGPAHA